MLTPTEIDLKREISNVLYITGLVTKGRTIEEIEEFLSSVDVAHTQLNDDATSLGGGAYGSVMRVLIMRKRRKQSYINSHIKDVQSCVALN